MSPTHIKLSELDIRIMEELARNPYAENKDLCTRLEIDHPRRLEDRLKRLRQAGLVTEQQRLADLAATGRRLRYRIDIKINPSILQKSSEIVALKDHYQTENRQQLLAYYIRDVIAKAGQGIVVEEVSILLGDPADLCATVLVPDHTTIFDFITTRLRALDEIENTSTSHVAWRIFRDAEHESQGEVTEQNHR